MGWITSASIGATGLTAAATRLRVTAHNVANSQTEGFKQHGTSLEEIPSKGVQVNVYAPWPQAYEEGLKQSGTDLVQETVHRLLALRTYQANLQTLRMSDQMTGSLLNIKS